MKHAQADSGTAAQAATNWNVATNLAGEIERLAGSNREKFSRRFANQPIAPAANASSDSDVIVERKRDTEAIETRPQVRSAGGNADSDLLHPPILSQHSGAARQAAGCD